MIRATPPIAKGLALCAIALALALEGCGRRGPLEPPPDPTIVATPASTSPEAPLQRPKVAPIAPPTRSLPFDALL